MKTVLLCQPLSKLFNCVCFTYNARHSVLSVNSFMKEVPI